MTAEQKSFSSTNDDSDLRKTLAEKEAELVDKTRNVKDLIEILKEKDAEIRSVRSEKEKYETECVQLKERSTPDTAGRAPDYSNGDQRQVGEEINRLKAELSESLRLRNIEKYDLQKVIADKNKVIEENRVTGEWLRSEIDKLKIQVINYSIELFIQ